MEDWPTSREHIEVISATEKGERADHRVTIAQGLLADTSVVNSVVPEGVRKPKSERPLQGLRRRGNGTLTP